MTHFKSTHPTGIVRGESNKSYHSSGCLGSGMVGDYIGSPFGFKLRHIDKHPLAVRAESSAMSLGTIIHTILQRGEVSVIPEEFSTTQGISKKPNAQAWLAAQGEKVLATPDQKELADFICQRVQSALPQIASAEYEVTARTKWHGMPVQCKYDLAYDLQKGIFSTGFDDIKTTSSPLKAFKKSCWDFHYLHQMAWYKEVGKLLGVQWGRNPRWLVIQTTYPFEFGYLVPDAAEMLQAHRELEAAMRGITAGVFDTPVMEQAISGLIKVDGPNMVHA